MLICSMYSNPSRLFFRFSCALRFLSIAHTYAASQSSTIWGPGVTVTKSFLKEEKLKTSFGASYNHSGSTTANINVMNFRLGANYMPWKQHSFNLNFIQMFRNTDQAIENPNLNEMTCTVGYNYSF